MKNMVDTALDFIKTYVNEECAGNVSKASRELGVSNTALWQWINGKRKPKLEAISPVLEHLNVDFFIAKNEVDSQVEEIKIFDAAGAGPAVNIHESEPLTTVRVPKNFFPSCDFGVQIQGHSMEPTIPNNSIVGIKTDLPFTANELYLADIPYEGRVVKRISVDLSANEFVFKSDNIDKEKYPEFRMNIDEASRILIGKVVWVLKR